MHTIKAKGETMKKTLGFSLAEALITLLIVSIIAVASAPIITKKARNNQNAKLWTLFNQNNNGFIYPKNNRDIKLGSKKEEKGIIVNGTLVFKNTKGEVIGWISEDGTNSFCNCNSSQHTPNIISQEELDNMVRLVTDSMKRQNIYLDNRQAIPNREDSSKINTPAATPQPNTVSQEELNRQLIEMGKNMNIDFSSLLQGLE